MGRTGQRISGCKNCRLKAHRKRLKFPANQRWCKLLNQKIEFVDQTLDTVRSFNSFSEGEAEADPGSPEDQPFPLLEEQDARQTSPCIGGQHNPDGLEQRPTSSPYSHTEGQLQTSSRLENTTLPFHQHPDQLPELVFQGYTPIVTDQIDSDWHTIRDTPQGTYASYGDRYQLGLPTSVIKREEAGLVRHFFSGVSDAFDLGDPDRAFSSWLSTRVLQYPRLLDSILTIASRHLGKEDTNTTSPDPEARSYSDFTLRLPSITSIINSTVQKTNSVTNLLLRFAHTMEAKDSIHPPTLGRENMIDEPREPTEQEDLPEAAWWANLRLEVYSAVITQTLFQISSNSSYADKKAVPVDNTGWANLMLLHLADIIRYCFSDSKDSENYTALLEDLTTWSQSKPDSFEPIYTCGNPKERVLPDIWVYDESVAAGLQYYHLGRMLLVSHDPRLPKIGLAKSRAIKRIEVEMKNDAKIVCAIADGMGDTNPTYLNACMSIALVGDLFDRRIEQDALFGILVSATERFGWPTSYIQEHLKEAWGWL
ncbi:hypothetical protein ACHAP7_010144 [Fusarium lateritium]